MLTVLLAILVGLTGLALFLFVFQRQFIYFPRSYDRQYDFKHYRGLIPLEYQTPEGKQTSFYLSPDNNSTPVPEPLWILFGGNAALALDWYGFAAGYSDPKAGFLLIEYPGYGKCEGKASPDTILVSTEQALAQLALHLQINKEQLTKHLHILGHSLGTGAGLQYAAKHPVEQIVLVSPFTSLLDVACRTVGKPICYLLQHRFDNQARLEEIASFSPLPQVQIIHGTLDRVIPVQMGRRLAHQFPQMIVYLEIQHANHNQIFSLSEQEIHSIMQGNLMKSNQKQ
ncbi:MAG: alpha/beta fold hydrolase [SAR324 cluster bacterium]|nr:alpha/beta fold hydrolase [SAR324 cluster bacterium]